jgi:hypothetical protein
MTNKQVALSQYMPIKPLISTLFKVTVFRDMLDVVREIGTGTSSGTTNILDKEARTLLP